MDHPLKFLIAISLLLSIGSSAPAITSIFNEDQSPGGKFQLPKTCALLFHKAGFTIEHPEVSPMEPRFLPNRVIKNLWTWYFATDAREKTDTRYEFLSDFDYIRGKRQYDKLGIVRSFFSDKYDTRIFYTATGTPDGRGGIPVVDPKARGLYVYFHGSGTNKASGINFSYKANKLAAMGYSVLSFDLPYHAEGSRAGAKFHDATTFYKMIKDMLDEYRVAGMPVYLAGHSFGPEIAAEFVTRYPYAVNGILGISPAAFNAELDDWSNNTTSRMTALWGPMVSNDTGANWAGIMAEEHIWKIPVELGKPDPQEINPELKVTFISGQYEEYVPGRLDERGLPTKESRDYDLPAALHKLFPHSNVVHARPV